MICFWSRSYVPARRSWTPVKSCNVSTNRACVGLPWEGCAHLELQHSQAQAEPKEALGRHTRQLRLMHHTETAMATPATFCAASAASISRTEF